MRPKCYNRPPRDPVRIEYGLDRSSGEVIKVEIRNDWCEDKCASWLGEGVGQPTEKYPNGTPYPMAHKWDCRGCSWLPEQHKGDADEAGT